ncbi:MAG: pyrimidine-nucleoside phosphorylase, partial [Firmicutes bacterium]|nr:pyrimidine-nucleoside phosphorylase [Bacillota bacterium]
AGVVLSKKVGDAVEAGEVLATFYGNDEGKVDGAMAAAKEAFVITEETAEAPKLIKEIIGL